MDSLDEKILGMLAANGRASFSELGREIGLSTAATAARVRRLESAGVILGYQAVLADSAPERAAALEAFIDVRLTGEQDSAEFLNWARRDRAVIDAVHLTGPYDYLLRVAVRDTGELDQLLRRLKQGGGAASTTTRIVLGRAAKRGHPSQAGRWESPVALPHGSAG